ncbi:MAG TPA: hypothetical protein VJ914_11985 [Pseudonocardiaceae bacterium]|nr:hypothetical protein [Pseudonocardiaceae bacterium]
MTRYARLLRLYPKDYRDRYGAELLDTLRETGRPRHTESLNLIRGALVAHARRLRPDSASGRDALAITSLLAPLLLLAGAADDLHETGWFVATHGSASDILHAFTPVVLWLAWAAVLALGLFRLRRTAMAGSWIAAAAMVVVLNQPSPGIPVVWQTGAGGWSLLAILAAIACTASDGIRRGYELVGRTRTILVAAAVALVLFTRVLGHNYTPGYLIALVIAAACAAYAAWRSSAIGWRVAALFITPVVATASTVWLYHGAPFRFQRLGIALPHIVYEYVPPLVVLALVIIAWRVVARRIARRDLPGKASS